MRRTASSGWVRALVSAGILGAVLVQIDLGHALDRAGSADWPWLAAGVGALAAAVVGAVRWHLFLAAAGVATSLGRALSAFLAGVGAAGGPRRRGLAGSPGRLGEVLPRPRRDARLRLRGPGRHLGLALARSVAVDVSWPELAVVTPPVLILSALPLSIGGLEVREISYVGLLAPLGVSATEATLLGLLTGLAYLVVTLPGAVVLARRLRRAAVDPVG